MNKVMTAALVAGGLMLLNSPQATAHTEARYSYQPPNYDYYARRSEYMPRWLKRNESFRKWYRHSSLKRNHRIAWGELFDIYRWEHRHGYRGNKRYRHNDYYSGHKRHRGHRGERRHRH